MKGFIHKLEYIVYRLGLHFDAALSKRWKWRRYLWQRCNTLEVGGGGGPWTIELLKRFNRVVCVDIGIDDLKRTEKKLKKFNLWNGNNIGLFHADIRDFVIDEKFDQIVIFEVLEHIKNDKAVICKLADMLKNNGQILISTPSSNFIPFYGEYIEAEENGGHVRKGYSFDDFERLLFFSGLTIVKKDSCGGYFTQKSIELVRKVTDLSRHSLLLRSKFIPLLLQVRESY